MRIMTLTLIYYGCALYSLLNPLFGLLFFVHITIFRPESLAWGEATFGHLHLTTALLTLIGYFVHENREKGKIDDAYQRQNVLIFSFFILWLVIVSILARSSVVASFEKTVEMMKIFALCFLFSKLINTKDRLNLYVWVTLVSFGLLSFWGFLQGLAGNPRLDDLGPGGSSMTTASIALMAPLALAKVFDTGLAVRSRLVFLLCTMSMALCIIYSFSRGGFLGLIVASLVFVIVTKHRTRILLGVAVTVLLVFPLIPDTYSARVSSIFADSQEKDQSSLSRPILWRIAFRIWQDHPIAGVGLDNFSAVKDTYPDKVQDILEEYLSTTEDIEAMRATIFDRYRLPHGAYTGMMAETGLVGISVFVFFMLRSIFCRFPALLARSETDRNLYLQVKAAQAGLIGFAVAALFADAQYVEMLYLQVFFVGAVRGYADSLMAPDRKA